MLNRDVEITNAVGLHARPAALFSETAKGYLSLIEIHANGKTANGKSLLEILSLGVSKGTIITIEVKGIDEQAAIDALIQLIQNNFGE